LPGNPFCAGIGGCPCHLIDVTVRAGQPERTQGDSHDPNPVAHVHFNRLEAVAPGPSSQRLQQPFCASMKASTCSALEATTPPKNDPGNRVSLCVGDRDLVFVESRVHMELIASGNVLAPLRRTRVVDIGGHVVLSISFLPAIAAPGPCGFTGICMSALAAGNSSLRRWRRPQIATRSIRRLMFIDASGEGRPSTM